MKFSAIALSALVGSTFAAPAPEAGDYEQISLRTVHDSNKLEKRYKLTRDQKFSLFTLAASTLTGIVTGPLLVRYLNENFGVPTGPPQPTKRETDVQEESDLSGVPFDDARKIYIDSYVKSVLKERAHDSDREGVICTGNGYSISTPGATRDFASIIFSSQGQSYLWDCFILTAPVVFEVKNATDDNTAWAAPANGTYENGVFTLV